MLSTTDRRLPPGVEARVLAVWWIIESVWHRASSIELMVYGVFPAILSIADPMDWVPVPTDDVLPAIAYPHTWSTKCRT